MNSVSCLLSFFLFFFCAVFNFWAFMQNHVLNWAWGEMKSKNISQSPGENLTSLGCKFHLSIFFTAFSFILGTHHLPHGCCPTFLFWSICNCIYNSVSVNNKWVHERQIIVLAEVEPATSVLCGQLGAAEISCQLNTNILCGFCCSWSLVALRAIF